MDDIYHSPIEISQIQEDLNIAFEDGVFKAVRRVGINVDKEELLKALSYDRGQYEQGYHDALKEQKHGHWVRLPKFLTESQCSVCGETYVGDCRTFNYCPTCGAEMDGEVKQDG